MSESLDPSRPGPGMSLAEARAQVGRALPGGHYTIDPWKAWLVADVLQVDQWDPIPHPVFAWLASATTMGVSWDELFAWFGATAADGPMFGEHETEFCSSLRAGATYRVTGEIVSVDRKVGRTAGTFDIVGYALELHDADGGCVARCFNSIVFPRKAS